ncbi:aldehyde ferredoxin oxidoreductase C-terminal domain-containing protein [Chloroflexota bacterium]
MRGAVSLKGFYSGPEDIQFEMTEYENIPQAVFWQLRAEEIENMAGICVFLDSLGTVQAVSVADCVELINSALGFDLTGEELMLAARRSYNLEKAFNTIHAHFKREDDYPPVRYMEEPVASGPYEGHRCDREKWDEMLDIFYDLHGWDTKTGLQTEKCLLELGLDEVAGWLRDYGSLP